MGDRVEWDIFNTVSMDTLQHNVGSHYVCNIWWNMHFLFCNYLHKSTLRFDLLKSGRRVRKPTNGFVLMWMQKFNTNKSFDYACAKEKSKLKSIEISIVNLIFFSLWLLSSAIITWVFSLLLCIPSTKYWFETRFDSTENWSRRTYTVCNGVASVFRCHLLLLMCSMLSEMTLILHWTYCYWNYTQTSYSHPLSPFSSHSFVVWCGAYMLMPQIVIRSICLIYFDLLERASVQSLYNLLTVFIEKTSIWYRW